MRRRTGASDAAPSIEKRTQPAAARGAASQLAKKSFSWTQKEALSLIACPAVTRIGWALSAPSTSSPFLWCTQISLSRPKLRSSHLTRPININWRRIPLTAKRAASRPPARRNFGSALREQASTRTTDVVPEPKTADQDDVRQEQEPSAVLHSPRRHDGRALHPFVLASALTGPVFATGIIVLDLRSLLECERSVPCPSRKVHLDLRARNGERTIEERPA